MYQNEKKEKAKKVNIIDFLRETYPELVFERKCIYDFKSIF